MYVAEYVGSTDRRPRPNATDLGSITSGLSFPSPRDRSGRYSIGSLKTSGSCNMDLLKKVRTEIRSNYSYWPRISNHNRPFRNMLTIIFIIVSSHVGNFWSYHDDKKRPTKRHYIAEKDNLQKLGGDLGLPQRPSSAWTFFWTSR